MVKFLKVVELKNDGVWEMKSDLLIMSQFVDSHSTQIEYTEQQINQLSTIFNKRKQRTLPSDTVQNPRNDGSSMVIKTRSGNILPGPCQGLLFDLGDEELEDEVHNDYPVVFETLKISF